MMTAASHRLFTASASIRRRSWLASRRRELRVVPRFRQSDFRKRLLQPFRMVSHP